MNQVEEGETFCAGWWRSDKLDSIGWAAIFIWGGLVMLAGTTGYSANYPNWNGWSVFFTGAGIIVLTEGLIRIKMPDFREAAGWNLFIGFILLGIGLDGLVGAPWIWPLVLFAIGILILIGTLQKEKPRKGPAALR